VVASDQKLNSERKIDEEIKRPPMDGCQTGMGKSEGSLGSSTSLVAAGGRASGTCECTGAETSVAKTRVRGRHHARGHARKDVRDVF